MNNIELDFSSLNLFLNLKSKEADKNINCSLTDENGTIIYVNDNFCQITEYKRSELIGQNHRIINSGYQTKEFYKNMWDTIKSGNTWQGELRNIDKFGKYFWVNTVIFPVYDKFTNERQFLAIRTSIDDKKQAEKEKEERISLLKHLLFKISHELRQPITQLLGMLELLKLDEIKDKELDFILNHFKSSVDLLDTYSRNMSNDVEKIADAEQISFSKNL